MAKTAKSVVSRSKSNPVSAAPKPLPVGLVNQLLETECSAIMHIVESSPSGHVIDRHVMRSLVQALRSAGARVASGEVTPEELQQATHRSLSSMKHIREENRIPAVASPLTMLEPKMPAVLPTSIEVRWQPFGENIQELDLGIVRAGDAFRLAPRPYRAEYSFELSQKQLAELLGGCSVMLAGQGYIWLKGSFPQRFCALESPTITRINGGEVVTGFCQECRKVHSSIQVDGRRVQMVDVNPVVAAAIKGIEDYLEGQRAEFTAYEAEQRKAKK
jgi:hypothetical protein